MSKPIQLTPKGLVKIQEELRFLKDERRQELSDYMGAALADGDLRENAAYDEARLLQSANETRIADLEEIVARAVVVEQLGGVDAVVSIGASLHVEDEKGEQHIFHLVGSLEADVFENRISDESLLGQQFVGRRAGEEVRLGSKAFRITAVVYE